MKERLFTLLCAVGALILFVGMFIRREGGLDPRNAIPRPTTLERRGNGYNAALTWLNAEKIHVVSLRKRFDKISELEQLPPSGNLLIVTLPGATPFDTDEFAALDYWIRAGNTLLVLAALSDTPDWAHSATGVAPGDLSLLTGLEFETVTSREQRLRKRARLPAEPADMRALAEPQLLTLIPNRAHVYFNQVNEVIALSDYAAQPWTVKVPYQGFVLALAQQRETGEGVLWTRLSGKGRIIVSAFGSLFTNRALGLADNGQLLANIIAANVHEGGTVLFDDVHQGLGAAYDPATFYKDRRLYITVAILMGLWLIWVVGSTRLCTLAPRSAAPREVDLVRAAGGFLARVLLSHAAAQRLLDHFFRRINERAQRRGLVPAWELLERHPRVAVADLKQLKDWYAAVHAARRVPLVSLYNLILRIDRQTT